MYAMRPSKTGPGVELENIDEVTAAMVVYDTAAEISATNPSGAFLGVSTDALELGASVLRVWEPEFFALHSTNNIGFPDARGILSLAAAVELARPDKAEAIAPLMDELLRITRAKE
jgi:hypothetical protein